jgi:hypothetical protein
MATPVAESVALWSVDGVNSTRRASTIDCADVVDVTASRNASTNTPRHTFRNLERCIVDLVGIAGRGWGNSSQCTFGADLICRRKLLKNLPNGRGRRSQRSGQGFAFCLTVHEIVRAL